MRPCCSPRPAGRRLRAGSRARARPCPAPWLWGAVSSPVPRACLLVRVPGSPWRAPLCRAPASLAPQAVLLTTVPPAQAPVAGVWVPSSVRFYSSLRSALGVVWVSPGQGGGSTPGRVLTGTACAAFPTLPLRAAPSPHRRAVCIFLVHSPRGPLTAVQARPALSYVFSFFGERDLVC